LIEIWIPNIWRNASFPVALCSPAKKQKVKRTISHCGIASKTKTTIILPLQAIRVPRKQKQKLEKQKQQLPTAATLQKQK